MRSSMVARLSGRSSLAMPDLNRSEEEMHHIYSGWALYFFKRDPEKTEYCFSKCLELNPWDANSLYLRSVAKRQVAGVETALDDSLAAARINNKKPQYDYEVCECYNQLKAFEKCKAELYNYSRKYHGAQAQKFLDRADMINEYIKDCLGPALATFINKHKARFPEVVELIQREKIVDLRPRWKILREQDKCDVVSVDEKEKEFISPLEKARRERWYRIFNQIYFGRNWVDKAFLRDLTKIDKYLPSYFLESTPLLKELIEPQNEAVKKFIKILHARSPLYVEKYRRFGNKDFAKKHTESYLFGQQYQARRKMFYVLRLIKDYRKKGNIEGMSKYIEETMGDFVAIKTHRIMPRKFEFINEVYNTLALAHADVYIKKEKKKVYANIFKDYPKYRLQRMLGLQIEKKHKSGFVFGDRSTYVPADIADPTFTSYKNFLDRMEKRLVFAKYPIEKAYLWHEIARAHFKRNNYGESQIAAKKSVEEAKSVNSNIWAFLSQMLIVKAFAAQHKIEYCRVALGDAADIVRLLKNVHLSNFVETASHTTDEEIEKKRSTVGLEMSRRRTNTSQSTQASMDSGLNSTRSSAAVEEGDDIGDEVLMVEPESEEI